MEVNGPTLSEVSLIEVLEINFWFQAIEVKGNRLQKVNPTQCNYIQYSLILWRKKEKTLTTRFMCHHFHTMY